MAESSETTQLHVADSVTLAIHSTTPPHSSSPTAPHLVFLHFWGGSSKTYSLVIHLLSASLRTHSVDFPGWGESTGPADDASAYSISSLASYISTFLSTLPQLSTIILVGHSMGAKVAQLVAARSPSLNLAGLILIAPAPLSPLVLPPPMQAQQLLAYRSTEAAREVVRTVLTHPGDLSAETEDLVVSDILRGSEAAKAAWPETGAAEDYSGEVGKIRVRTLVVGGEMDRVEEKERVEREVVERIEGAKGVWLEGCGHLVPLEKPMELAREVRRFLEG